MVFHHSNMKIINKLFYLAIKLTQTYSTGIKRTGRQIYTLPIINLFSCCFVFYYFCVVAFLFIGISRSQFAIEESQVGTEDRKLVAAKCRTTTYWLAPLNYAK